MKKHPKQGVKHDALKPEMDLLPREALVEVAKVLSFGAKKYGRFNWRQGIAWSRVISAAMRHLSAFNEGIDKDEETSLSHLSHAACNLMFLIQYEKDHPEFDDRYTNEQTPKAGRSRAVKKSAKKSKKPSKKSKKETRKS